RGMGAVYTATSDCRPLRNLQPRRRAELLDRFFHSYADALAETVDHVLARHGWCVIIDLHSYPTLRLPYELGAADRPELCIGTDSGHTPPPLVELVVGLATEAGYEVGLDSPFAGTYVPLRHLGSP